MSPSQRGPCVNRLLDSLPNSDRRQIIGESEAVALEFADELCTPYQQLTHVHFPTSGFISLITTIEGGASLEVGLIGNEGMFGLWLALGVDVSPVRAVVQGAGSTLRMEATVFRHELGRRPALQRKINRYAVVHLTQLAQTAACTRFHVVEARLARWLLMSQDRAGADSFHVTQEMLAFVLGVRRVGVTKAAGALQRQGLIQYHRGDIRVLDRRGLIQASCGCYKADLESYDRFLG